MPPKSSKGSSKTPAKAKTPTLTDGFTKEEPSREQNKEISELLSKVSDENAEIEKEMKYSVIEKDVDGKVEEKKLDELKRDYETLEQTFCTKHLDSGNDSIKNLEYKKAQLSQARKDLLLTYDAWCGGGLRKAI